MSAARRFDDRRSAAAQPPVRVVRFDERKYGRYLLADAGQSIALPGFITTPEPHRLTFFEIALVEGGDGHLLLDGEALEVRPRSVIVTMPGEARSWRLREPLLRASLAFFEPRMLDGLADVRGPHSFPFMTAPRAARTFTPARRDFDRLLDLVACMREELSALGPDSSEMLRAQLHHLLVLVQRHCRGSGPVVADAGNEVSRRFVELVEERFCTWSTVGRYAAEMHISSRHLNACVHRATGRTASGVIHDRLILESQRRLLGTTQTVAAIGEALNFSDVSYFVRFFRRRTGCTPAAFRRGRGSPIVHREVD